MQLPKPVYDLLITAPTDFVAEEIVQDFKNWEGEATSTEIMYTLDKITYHGLAGPFIIEVLELLFANAIEEEGITEDEALAKRTWDEDHFKRG